MESLDLTLRLAERSDAEAFLGLFRRYFHQSVDSTAFEWRYFSANPRSFLATAWDQENLAGMNGGNVFNVRTVDQNFLLFFMIHVTVAEGYRGKGLYQRLWDFVLEQAKTQQPLAGLYGFSNPTGWRAAHKMGPTDLISEVCLWTRKTEAMPIKSSGISFIETKDFGQEGDQIQDSFLKAHPHLVMIARDSKYLNWRFAKNPSHDYHIFLVKKENETAGYLVLKIFSDPKTGEKLGDIVDFLWVREEREYLKEALRFSLNYFHMREVRQATIWLHTNTLMDEIGKEIGFLPTDKSCYFNYKIFDERYGWIGDKNRWFITMADTEVY